MQVEVTFKGTSHRFGVIATDDIDIDETLFEIPRKALITPTSGSISSQLKRFEEEMSQKNQRYCNAIFHVFNDFVTDVDFLIFMDSESM